MFINLINYAFHLDPILQGKGWFSQRFPLLASWELLQSQKQLFSHKIYLFCRSTAKFIINFPWMYSITADLFSLPNTIRFKRSFRTFPQILCSLFDDLAKSRSKENSVLLGAFNSLNLVAIAAFLNPCSILKTFTPYCVYLLNSQVNMVFNLSAAYGWVK